MLSLRALGIDVAGEERCAVNSGCGTMPRLLPSDRGRAPGTRCSPGAQSGANPDRRDAPKNPYPGVDAPAPQGDQTLLLPATFGRFASTVSAFGSRSPTPGRITKLSQLLSKAWRAQVAGHIEVALTGKELLDMVEPIERAAAGKFDCALN